MKQHHPARGFFLSLGVNLLFGWRWAGLAALLLGLHLWLKLPWFLAAIACALWLGKALAVTALLFWGSSCSDSPPLPSNKNPYSARTEDILPPENRP